MRDLLLVAVMIAVMYGGLQAQCAPTSEEKPVAVKVAEIQKISRTSFHRHWRTVWRSIPRDDDIYIINYGTSVEIARRERWVTELMGEFESIRARVWLLRGGRLNGPKSVFWKVPAGADYPKP